MVKAVVIAGYGINCEEETAHVFEHLGGQAQIIHVNDLIEDASPLKQAQIIAFAGGFSYGDDTGSGNGFARKIENHFKQELLEFHARDTLMIGICNGCQILSRLGLVGSSLGTQTVALAHNDSNRYQCRWVHLQAEQNDSPWLTKDMEQPIYVPVAHGEGKFIVPDDIDDTLVALRYVNAQGELANGTFPVNPNGSLQDIAGVFDNTGRVLALMPHPERAFYTWQRADYPVLKDAAQRQNTQLPEYADGKALFANALNYFA